MDLYHQKDRSIPQKIVLLVLEILMIAISYWVLFAGGFEFIFSPKLPNPGNEIRHGLLFAFNLIVFVRMGVTMFHLVKRRIPWEEAFSIPFAFALYFVGFSILGYQANAEPDLLDLLAIALFISGSWLNTGSELARDKWKKNPANQGQLYTIGLFRYSMHINYFGDLLWVLAYALVTRNLYALLIPLLLFCFFAFYNIPKLDAYLASRYGQQFEDYKRKTKKLIPFVY